MEHEPERLVTNLTGRVAPTTERGASALLSGASSSARRAAIDALVEGLRARRPEAPLVVRAPAYAAGQRLPEALADAVESALVARRAPGGLYEESGEEVLRTLGPWLFRARSVGFAGLVLVIDELDTWIDARGGRGSLGPWLGRLLAQCGHRALSVVASARAADAAGTPSLPHEVVDRFDLRESLGGPVAVLARDPGTLVAALAGRTFSRSGLRAALDAWLDVPPEDGDDALLVFSSPLAPPPTWTPPPLTELRPSTPIEVRPAPSSVPASPVTPSEIARWGETLGSSVELASVLRAARSATPHDRESAEAAFRGIYVKIPRRVERLAAGVELVGAERPKLLDAARAAMDRFDGVVRGIAASLPAEDPSTDALDALCAAHAKTFGARTRATLSLTGLRADLGETLLSRVLLRLPGAKVVAQGLRWVPPASPERARALADVVARTPWEDAVHPQREHDGGRELYRVTAYAKALTTGARSLDEVAEGVESALGPALQSWRAGFGGPLAFLVFADVGVGPADARGERMLGDGSAFGQILPWWILTAGA